MPMSGNLNADNTGEWTYTPRDEGTVVQFQVNDYPIPGRLAVELVETSPRRGGGLRTTRARWVLTPDMLEDLRAALNGRYEIAPWE